MSIITRVILPVFSVFTVFKLQTIFCMAHLSMVRIPENPCPSIFAYKYVNGIYSGEVSIPYDGSKNLDLQVNVSLVGYYNDLHLPIELLTPTDKILNSRIINYRVNFPFSNIIPKITQIQYNGNIYCYGPPEPLDMRGVTNLWSKLTYKIQQYTYTVQTGIPNQNQNSYQNPNQSPNQIPNRNPNCCDSHITKTPDPPDSQIIIQTPAPTPPLFTTPILPPNTVVHSNDVSKSESQIETCGIPIDIRALVFNGEKTSENEFPWLVAMFFRLKLSYQFKCTANLISNQHVITAGHCVQYYKAPLIPMEDILLVLDCHDLTHWATIGAPIRTPEQVMVHPNYEQSTGNYDLAVIKLNKEVTFKPTIRPICLWAGETDLKKVVGMTGTVAGWGKDETGAETVPQPKKVVMPIVSQEDCLRSNTKFLNLTSDVTFCAGNRNGGGPCSGDSGAGLVVNIAGKYFLRGVVSTAILEKNSLSCDLSEFVIFADAAKLKKWIQDSMTK